MNFNDPSGHFAGGFGGGITNQMIKRELLGPPGGTIWDQAMGMFYDETIGGTYVSYSDWVTGGDSTKTGEEKEQVDPFASIPEASTLPEDQRNAYVLYGLPTPEESEKKVIPFPDAAAGESADFLTNKGYNVKTIQITSNSQLKTMSQNGDFRNSIVVVAAHFFPFFYWNQGLSTSGSIVAKWLGSSGASRVIYMSCKSSVIAMKTSQIGGMPTWGAGGYLHPHFKNPPDLYISGGAHFFGYIVDYWYITQH